MLAEAKLAREKAAKVVADGDRVIVNTPHHYYSLPYLGTSDTSHWYRNESDEFKRAFYALVCEIGEKASHRLADKSLSLIAEQHDAAWHSIPASDNYPVAVLLRPAVLNCLRRLYTAANALTCGADAAGRRAGSDVVMQLARGDLSINDFLAATVPPRSKNQI